MEQQQYPASPPPAKRTPKLKLIFLTVLISAFLTISTICLLTAANNQPTSRAGAHNQATPNPTIPFPYFQTHRGVPDTATESQLAPTAEIAPWTQPPTPEPTRPPVSAQPETPEAIQATPTRTPSPTPTREPPPQLPQPQPAETPHNEPFRTLQQVDNADWAYHHHPDLTQAISHIPWITDGIDELENNIVRHLFYMAIQDQADVAMSLTEMPFLNTPEPADYSAIRALWNISSFHPDQFLAIKQHPTFQDGITDPWTHVFATLDSVAAHNPDLIATLLNHRQVTVETSTANLPMAGTVQLAIVRTQPGSSEPMPQLAYAAEIAERITGQPFPTKHIVLLFAESVAGNSSATNHQTHIVMLPAHDQPPTDDDGRHTPYIIAHEVAHYYWHANAEWLDEGLAELHATITEAVRTNTPITDSTWHCESITAIAQLPNPPPLPGTVQYECNYKLGYELFKHLVTDLDPQQLQDAINHLYRLSQQSNPDSTFAKTRLGIEHVEAVLTAHPDVADIVRQAYYGDSHIPTDPAPAVNTASPTPGFPINPDMSNLQPQRVYQIHGCVVNTNDKPRQWVLFQTADPIQPSNVFAIHFQQLETFQDGACYQADGQYLEPIEWRICPGRPYGANCAPQDEDFLWQANIHAFLAQRDHMRQIHPQADMQSRNPVDQPIINTPPPTEATP